MSESTPATTRWTADTNGRFGRHGGTYVPETLRPAVAELIDAYERYRIDPESQSEFLKLCTDFVGRPRSDLPRCKSQSPRRWGSDLAQTGKPSRTRDRKNQQHQLGQGLLAKRMGKQRHHRRNGSWPTRGGDCHGVCAVWSRLRGVYGRRRYRPAKSYNVYRMRLLGAEVRAVSAGTRTLKDAINEAIRDWVTNVGDTSDLIGFVVGMHPYPTMVRDFQSVIGREARAALLEPVGRADRPMRSLHASAAAATRLACSIPFSMTLTSRSTGPRLVAWAPKLETTPRHSCPAPTACSLEQRHTCCKPMTGR